MTAPTDARHHRQHRGSARRQAERAILLLHSGEMQDVKAAIEAGADMRQIVRERRARQHPGADRAAMRELAELRSMVMARLARQAAGHEPWPGPLLTPYEVDLGQVNMWLYLWAAILLGVTLAQNALDGNPAAAGRPIPDKFALWDTRLPEFWHGDADDDHEPPKPIGDWPLGDTVSQASSKADAA